MSSTPALVDAPALPEARPHIPAHLQIFAGMALGAGGGLAVNLTVPHAAWVEFVVANITQPIGGLFLRLLLILVLPLLFSAVITGVAGLRDVGTLRRLGMQSLFLMVTSTVLAALIGLAMVNLFRPGDGVDQSLASQLLLASRGQALLAPDQAPVIGPGAIVNLVPFNILGAATQGNLLGVIVFAFLLGIGLLLVRTEATRQLVTTIEGLFQVGMRLIGLVIRLAPIAVCCFMFDLTVRFGWSLLVHLGAYVGVVLFAIVLHLCIVLGGMVWVGAGVRPVRFFRSVQETAFIAFTTASSHATLPASLKVAQERFGIAPEIARFILGIGTSANQNGSTIYQGITVVFLAQALGIQLELSQQMMVFGVCVLAGIGTAGVPAGSLPVVAMVLALVGVPPEAIGLVVGVDRLLDMCRTTLNVIGDLAIAVTVADDA